MIQGVAVFSKNEQSASAVFQFIELGFRKAIAKCGEFGIGGVIAHAACLCQQIPKHTSFGPELVEFTRRRGFVGQEIGLGIVKSGFLLLNVSESALNLCEA